MDMKKTPDVWNVSRERMVSTPKPGALGRRRLPHNFLLDPQATMFQRTMLLQIYGFFALFVRGGRRSVIFI
jgi:hypothetical protein